MNHDRTYYSTRPVLASYAPPYLVITPQGYTKHYYAEAERVTSQLGKGQFADVGTPVVSDSLVQVKLQAVTGNVRYPVTLTAPSSSYFSYLDTLTNRQNATLEAYWYHTDHLGSSSWITYTDGDAVQHLHYLPFGENFVDQKSNSFDGVRYTFSAKEKDTETGYSYFGSRYYSSDLSIWLSVDPQASKYPSLSPYTYCANNPVKLVDPNGEEIYVGDDYYYRNGYLYYKGTKDIYVPEQGSFEEKALNSLNKLQSTKQGGELMTPFEGETGKDVIIKNASNNPHTPGKVEFNDEVYSQGAFKSASIYWNPDGEELFNTLEPNATTDLGHEFSHAYDKANGTTYPTDNVDNCPRNEWQAVYRENMIRNELGVPYRKGYKVLRYNRMDGTTTPYLTKMLTPGGLPYVP